MAAIGIARSSIEPAWPLPSPLGPRAGPRRGGAHRAPPHGREPELHPRDGGRRCASSPSWGWRRGRVAGARRPSLDGARSRVRHRRPRCRPRRATSRPRRRSSRKPTPPSPTPPTRSDTPWSAWVTRSPVAAQNLRNARMLADVGGDLSGTAVAVAERAGADDLQMVDGVFPLDAARRGGRRARHRPRHPDERIRAPRRCRLAVPPRGGPCREPMPWRRGSRMRPTSIEVAAEATRLLPGLLGQDEDRRWIVALLTPSEQRGAGGLAGDYAELRTTGGDVDLVETYSAAELNERDRSAGAGRAAPADLPRAVRRLQPELLLAEPLRHPRRADLRQRRRRGLPRPPLRGRGRRGRHHRPDRRRGAARAHRADHGAALARADHRRQRPRRAALRAVRPS